YYAFMAAWLNVFLLVGMSAALRVGLAVLAVLIGLINVKDFLAFRRGVSLSIPESAKPGIYARARAILKAESLPASLAAVAVLAVVVNFVELLCTAGLPAIYTAVLTGQDLSPLAHYGYLGLYILAYIADDALMVGTAVLALGSGKLGERGGRMLKLLSGVVMLALGAVMLLRPEWLM
ncbi:MAG TPA: NrdH-redoxin, partial [Thauera aminoaromatica]|nr:NrdH-redoxin [Thauera aminoaromatica]